MLTVLVLHQLQQASKVINSKLHGMVVSQLKLQEHTLLVQDLMMDQNYGLIMFKLLTIGLSKVLKLSLVQCIYTKDGTLLELTILTKLEQRQCNLIIEVQIHKINKTNHSKAGILNCYGRVLKV